MQARTRKQHNEYAFLISDLEDREWRVTYDTVEVGSLGHFSQESCSAFEDFLMTIDQGSIQKIIFKAASLNLMLPSDILSP